MIYLDHAATSPPDPEIIAGLAARQHSHFANPKSTHALGVEAGRLLEAARGRLSRALGGRPSELIFTSGGTEALALAFSGSAGEAGRVALCGGAHAAIRSAAGQLATRGFEVDTLPLDEEGRLTPEALSAHLHPKTRALALIMAQNETGAINDIAALSRAAHAIAPRARIIVDAVQALGKAPIDARRLGADALIVTAHKIHGPKGIGALWTPHALTPLFKGGGQERGMRGGTQSAPLAWAFAEAVERQHGAAPRLSALRDRLFAALRQALPQIKLVGPPLDGPRLPNLLMLLLPGLPGEPLLNALSAGGVCASSGSACAGGRFSETLTAMGHHAGEGAFLRLSVGRFNTEDEIDDAARIIAEAARSLGEVYG